MQTEYVHFGIVIVHEIDEENQIHRLFAPNETDTSSGLWVDFELPACLTARQVNFEGRIQDDKGKVFCIIPLGLKPPEKKKK